MINLRKGTIMSHRINSLAAVIMGLMSISALSTEAFAYRGAAVGHRGAVGYRGGVGYRGAGGAYHVHRSVGYGYRGYGYRGYGYRGAPVARGLAIGAGAAAAGAAVARPPCGYYPYGPCY
ncbi:hypothetical protein Bind_3150 [Beijerinckia indica subsp. indica ATCC 9039]|uniref:Uncharacterized protein n=1 Tax=Beijerinckia indica subsp. indica (strain ATCC 9039 / DSM 1715 / NCIMB 8712) TaxID=395963 RepID=B2ICB4_BEII9|nr:hypothetical protein Bind_3150 [Beijerinckia indica subsp. indica ATCC 9039]